MSNRGAHPDNQSVAIATRAARPFCPQVTCSAGAGSSQARRVTPHLSPDRASSPDVLAKSSPRANRPKDFLKRDVMMRGEKFKKTGISASVRTMYFSFGTRILLELLSKFMY